MKIAVCVKRVPSTDAKVKPGPGGTSIDPAGVEYVVNPYDEFAVEEALKIQAAKGGEVVIVSVGPEEAKTQIRTCLAMGADRGILVKEPTPTRDPAAVGAALAHALKSLSPDLVFFGKQAVDGDSAQVPAHACHALGIPCVSVIVKLELGDGKATAHRQIEGGVEVVETTLPAGFTCQKGLNTPRYASLPNIMKAKKKPIEEMEAPAVPNRLQVVKMEPPPPRSPGRIVGTGVEAVPELVRLLKEEAKVI